MRFEWTRALRCSWILFAAMSAFMWTPIAADELTALPTTIRTLSATAASAATPVNRMPPTEIKSVSFITDRELLQTTVFLLFGLIVLFIEYLLLHRANADADQILKVFCMTLIIVGTLVAVSAGFRLEQTAAAIGLFGTVAGYLLGKRDAPKT